NQTGIENEAGTGIVTNSGDPFMSMLVGLSTSYFQPQSMAIRHYVNQTTSGYVNDNWKVSPRLSLQLGLRYDALPHAWERNNDVSNFDSALYYTTQQPNWNKDGSMDPTGPGFQTVGGIPYYLNGIGLAGQNGFP